MKIINRKGLSTVFVVVLIIAFGIVWILTESGNGCPLATTSARMPLCQMSQIDVKLGPNMKLSSRYPLAEQLVPIFFNNVGSACRFRIGGPVALAIVGNTPVSSAKLSELSFPAVMSPSSGVVNVSRGHQIEALFEVGKVPASGNGKVRTCILRTGTRLAIGEYALPIGQQSLFNRKLHGVCFESGGVSPKVNTSIIWLKE